MSSLLARVGARTGPMITSGVPPALPEGRGEGKEEPRVLLSTSLLTRMRGLDFDQSVSHVFVLELPRNTADFCVGRGAQRGREVVFGNGERGADKMRQRIYALKTRR